jgi:site-specific recombinase XerD
MKPNTFPNLLHTFFHEWAGLQRNLSHHTVMSYRDTWRLFLRFVAGRRRRSVSDLAIEDFTADEVLAFLRHSEEERKVTIGTRNCRLAALRSFFRFVADREPLAVAQCAAILRIPTKKAPTSEIHYLDVDEVTAILRQPDRSTLEGQRDHALLALLYNTGARIQEALDLCPRSVRLRTHAQVTLIGKGRVCFIKHTRPNVSNFYMLYSSTKTADFAFKMPRRLFLTTHKKRRSMAAPGRVSKELRPCLSRYSNAGTTSLVTLRRPLRKNASGIWRSVYAAEMPRSS